MEKIRAFWIRKYFSFYIIVLQINYTLAQALRYRLERNNTAGFNMSKSPNDRPRVADVTAHDVKAALTGLEFGSVVVTVHHGRIVQIERREKMRLDNSGRSPLPDLTNTHAD